MPNYLLPTGRDGFNWKPEIIGVLKKYQKLKVDLSEDVVVSTIATEINDTILKLGLEAVEIDDAPSRKADKLLEE